MWIYKVSLTWPSFIHCIITFGLPNCFVEKSYIGVKYFFVSYITGPFSMDKGFELNSMQSHYWSPKRPRFRVSFLSRPNLQSSGPSTEDRTDQLIDVEIIIGECSRNKSKNHVKFLAVMTLSHATQKASEASFEWPKSSESFDGASWTGHGVKATLSNPRPLE